MPDGIGNPLTTSLPNLTQAKGLNQSPGVQTQTTPAFVFQIGVGTTQGGLPVQFQYQFPPQVQSPQSPQTENAPEAQGVQDPNAPVTERRTQYANPNDAKLGVNEVLTELMNNLSASQTDDPQNKTLSKKDVKLLAQVFSGNIKWEDIQRNDKLKKALSKIGISSKQKYDELINNPLKKKTYASVFKTLYKNFDKASKADDGGSSNITGSDIRAILLGQGQRNGQVDPNGGTAAEVQKLILSDANKLTQQEGASV